MRRPWQIWLAFAACVALMAYAVFTLSNKAIEYNHAEIRASRQAAREQRALLALWRMDAEAMSIINKESLRPPNDYVPYLIPVGEPQLNPDGLSRTQAYLTSPLMTRSSPEIKLYFQIDPEERLTSPQVPTGPVRDKVVNELRLLSADNLEKLDALLADIREKVSYRDLMLTLPSPTSGARRPRDSAMRPRSAAGNLAQSMQDADKGDSEFKLREQYLQERDAEEQPADNTLRMNPYMRPVWLGDELILARQVTRNDKRIVQGCVLNWPVLKQALEASVEDLLPQAELIPVKSPSEVDKTRMLVNLQAKLELGAVPFPTQETGWSPLRWSPLRWVLVSTWGFLLIAVIASASLLHGVVALSERRAAFVSAVTHELRTPLTTFRMYADMLAQGVITDEATRRRYLNTLRLEADRLYHLVENVLSYARLERNRPGTRAEVLSVEQLIDRNRERLAERAHQANFELVTDIDPAAHDAQALADPFAVDQILFNLIDNACKYATFPSENLLHVEARAAGQRVELRVRDHGPGIAPHERRRLFQAFRKSANEAARTAPGVGLGLALSRRMARQMRGELKYEADRGGACFVLSLPLADPNRPQQRPALASVMPVDSLSPR